MCFFVYLLLVSSQSFLLLQILLHVLTTLFNQLQLILLFLQVATIDLARVNPNLDFYFFLLFLPFKVILDDFLILMALSALDLSLKIQKFARQINFNFTNMRQNFESIKLFITLPVDLWHYLLFVKYLKWEDT